MRKKLALVATGAALLIAGVSAGSVFGGDGSQPVVDRLPSNFGPIPSEVAHGFRPSAVASGGGGKLKVAKGHSDVRTAFAGDTDGIIMKCPKKYAAIDAGFDAADAGVVPGWLAPSEKGSGKVDTRGMTVAVLNLTGADIAWRAWVTCAKPVKSES